MANWAPLATSPERPPALRSVSAVRSILIMIAIPPAVGLMGLMGITAWEHWAASAGVVVALLVTPIPRLSIPLPRLLQYSRIIKSEAGLEVHHAWRDFRRLLWETIDWVSVEDVATVFDLFDAQWIRVQIGLRDEKPLKVLVPNTKDAELAVFLWELNEEIARRKRAEARQRLETGSELDFGVVRLSRTQLMVREGRRWTSHPLTPWRSAGDEQPPMRSFELAHETFRNPALFVHLLPLVVPTERARVDRTSGGGIRRLTIAVQSGGAPTSLLAETLTHRRIGR